MAWQAEKARQKRTVPKRKYRESKGVVIQGENYVEIKNDSIPFKLS